MDGYQRAVKRLLAASPIPCVTPRIKRTTPMPEHSPEPWDWLKHCVSLDGEGYCFVQSPAGGRMPITNEQRLRIVACVNACRGIPSEKLDQAAKGEVLVVLGNAKKMQQVIKNSPDAEIVPVNGLCGSPNPNPPDAS